MRQAGVLAAAGIYALANNVARLAEDHARAARLGEGLANYSWLELEKPQTNMVFVRLPKERGAQLLAHLKSHGVLATGDAVIRMVTHLDIDDAGIAQTLSAFGTFKP